MAMTFSHGHDLHGSVSKDTFYMALQSWRSTGYVTTGERRPVASHEHPGQVPPLPREYTNHLREHCISRAIVSCVSDAFLHSTSKPAHRNMAVVLASDLLLLGQSRCCPAGAQLRGISPLHPPGEKPRKSSHTRETHFALAGCRAHHASIMPPS